MMSMLGYLVAVDAPPGADPKTLGEILQASVLWVDGVKSADVDYLGEIETVDDQVEQRTGDDVV